MFNRIIDKVASYRRRRRAALELAHLSRSQLRDIGLSPHEIHLVDRYR